MSRTFNRAYVITLLATFWCFPETFGTRIRRSNDNVAMARSGNTGTLRGHHTKVNRPNGFYALAQKIDTDKVNGHHYEVLYDKYLHDIADENLRLLEGKEHLLQS